MKVRLLMIVGVCSLLMAGPAAAATPGVFPRGALYGGGLIGQGKLEDPQDQLVAIGLSKDRKQLNFIGTILADCDNGDFAIRYPHALSVPVRSDGTFAGPTAYHDKGPGGHEDGTFAYQGRFNGTDPASGTARLKFTITLTGGSTFKCDSGKFAWRVRDPAHAPGSGSKQAGAGYYGLRSDVNMVEFRVAPNGRSVSDLFFDTAFTPSQCSNADIVPARRPIGVAVGIPIQNGGFKKTDSIDLFLDPGRPRYSFKIAAQFGSARVTGTMSYSADVHDDQGHVVSHCVAPSLPIKLERG